MTKEEETRIEEEAQEYINNDLTEKQTAEKLGINRRTLQLHLKKLTIINQELYNLVLKKKESNIKTGRIKGGQIGKITGPNYTREDALEKAQGIIDNLYTYEEAAAIYGIPRSTIYEMVHSDFVPENIKMQLDLVAARNNREKNAKGNII